MLNHAFGRLTTTLIVVLSLLFSQFAMASYACATAAQQAAEPEAMEMASGEPCESMAMAHGMKMDQEQPVLCHQHCVDAPQTFEPMQLPAISLPAVVQVLVVPVVLDAGAADQVQFAAAGNERPPPDPLFLSTLRLRV
jgi:hypothetical protein